MALPGGIAFKVGDEIIRAVSVGSSPSGNKNKAGAQAGVAKAVDLLNK